MYKCGGGVAEVSVDIEGCGIQPFAIFSQRGEGITRSKFPTFSKGQPFCLIIAGIEEFIT